MGKFEPHGAPKFEFSKIIDYIYIGTNQCCKMHFDQRLVRRGIKADISLEAVKIDHPFGVDFYLWLPTRNHSPPSQAKLLMGAWIIKWLVDHRVKVYIHCKNGHGRASTLTAAYFILEGKTARKAIALIKKKRSAIHLTARQIAALEKFEVIMRGV